MVRNWFGSFAHAQWRLKWRPHAVWSSTRSEEGIKKGWTRIKLRGCCSFGEVDWRGWIAGSGAGGLWCRERPVAVGQKSSRELCVKTSNAAREWVWLLRDGRLSRCSAVAFEFDMTLASYAQSWLSEPWTKPLECIAGESIIRFPRSSALSRSLLFAFECQYVSWYLCHLLPSLFVQLISQPTIFSLSFKLHYTIYLFFNHKFIDNLYQFHRQLLYAS